MQFNATHPLKPTPWQAMPKLAGFLVVCLLILATSLDAFAQERVLVDQYEQLVAEFEEARKYDAMRSTPVSVSQCLQIL